MMNCFKRRFSFIAILLVGTFAALTCCTKVDNTLGLGLLPDDQKLKVGVMRLGGDGDDVARTHVTWMDTLNTKNIHYFFLGKEKSDTFGVKTYGGLVQFLPYNKKDDAPGYGFGYNPTVDSVKLYLQMGYSGGNQDSEQTFYIYDMKKAIDTASSAKYYNTIRYEDFIDTDHLFEFKYKGVPPSNNNDSVKLEITPKGHEFLQRLFADTTLFYKENFGKFHEKFNGFGIFPAPSSTEDGACYAVTTYNAQTAITDFGVFFHNYDEKDPAKVTTNAIARLHFSSSSSLAERNMSVASIRHDYAGTPIEQYVADSTLVAPAMYVDIPAGVTSKIVFTDEFYKAIEELTGSEYSGIVFNQALMYVRMENPELDFLSTAPTRLGSYLNYATWEPIADYQYRAESNNVTLAYGGYLSRTHGFYMMDITEYLQKGISDEAQRKPLTLGADYSLRLQRPTRVSLKGYGSDEPVHVKIIYTLIR